MRHVKMEVYNEAVVSLCGHNEIYHQIYFS